MELDSCSRSPQIVGAGKKLAIADPATGEIREAEIFVAVLGASGYTYAEVTWTQTLPDWIGSHVRMFEFFQGCPRLVVPDNLKSGVNKPSFFDPEINRSYAMLAAHYRAPRGLDRALLLKLASNDWIRKHRNCLIVGPAGIGKSWLACALGDKACREDFSVLYYRVPRLLTALALAHGDGHPFDGTKFDIFYHIVGRCC